MSDFILKLGIYALLIILLIPVLVIGVSGGGYQPKKTNKPRFPPPRQNKEATQ